MADDAVAPTGKDPFAVFRPRRGRIVAITAGVIAVVLFTTVGMFMPLSNWHPPDRIFFAALGWALAVLFWRYATIRAIPTREGLTVRNLVLTRSLVWPQVVGISFEGDPWVRLDLDDGDTLSVMAIQRADGDVGRAEAARLAALVHALGTAHDVEG